MTEKRVFWAVLMERSIEEHAANALFAVAGHCARLGYTQIRWPYQRVDVARNSIVHVFRGQAQSPDDTLIMLDADHIHPADIVERLVKHDIDVVGALAFQRGEPFAPCWFTYNQGFHAGYSWDGMTGVMAVDAVGTGAIAIKRRVFDTLAANGFGPYFFQAMYPDLAAVDLKGALPPAASEDLWFATTCMQMGIKHHVDLDLVTPHITIGGADQTFFEAWKKAHPEVIAQEVEVQGL